MFDGLSHVVDRLGDMQRKARRRGKRAPLLSELLRYVRADCPTCGVLFGALGRGSARSDSPSLQHWADGSVSIICHGCNVRDMHGRCGVPAGSVPDGQKRCSRCETAKPFDCFSRNRQARDGLSWWCRACSAVSQAGCRARRRARRAA